MLIQKIKLLLSNNIFLLALSSVFFILRSNIPYSVYLFAILQSIVAVKLISEKGLFKIIHVAYNSFRTIYLYYLLCVFFIIAFFIGPRESFLYKELLNVFVLISFIVFLFATIDDKLKLKAFINFFSRTFIVIFSAYLLTRFLFHYFNDELNLFFFAIKNSKNFDRNLYALNLLVCIVLTLYHIFKTNKKSHRIIGNVFILLFAILVVFSSSRRGISFFVLIIFILIGLQIYFFLFRKTYKNKIRLSVSIFSIPIAFSLLLLILSPNQRFILFNKAITKENTKDATQRTLHRYYRLIYPKATLNKFKYNFFGIDTTLIKNQNIKESYDEILLLANQKYNESNFTESFDLLKKAKDLAPSDEDYYKLLPNLIKKTINYDELGMIDYLPEIAKVPYCYNGFFSCKNINNLNLINYNNENREFPFLFSFKTDTASINLVVPALPNSEYTLSFKLIQNKDIIKKLKVTGNNKYVQIKQDIQQNNDTLFYKYVFTFNDYNKISSKINILLERNEVSKFGFSDISWQLNSTTCNMVVDAIYKRAQLELKNFKFEQSRTDFLWKYYLNAEKETSLEGLKKYDFKELRLIFDSINYNLRPFNYSNGKLLNKKGDKILFEKKHDYPRARIDLPIIQNSTYLFEYHFTKNTNQSIENYLSKKPQIHNVYFDYKILYDSIIQITKGKYKRAVKFKVDSINSASIHYIFGIKKPKKTDTINISNVNLKIESNNSSNIVLSLAQYSYLKNWASKGQINYNVNTLQEESKLYENKEYWNLDKKITSSYDRVELLTFGLKYFKELTFLQKVFGEGFNHHRAYFLKFTLRKLNVTEGANPHNPLLSALLYSGLIGAFTYFIFIIMLIIYTIKHNKILGVFSILLLLVFLFIFFSTNGVFTDPIFIVFSIFPFLVQNIKKKVNLQN